MFNVANISAPNLFARLFAFAAVLLLPLAGARAQAGPAGLHLLTTNRAVRELTPAEAMRGYPIKVRAIVTGFPALTASGYFVLDATAPIYVLRDRALTDLPPFAVGQIVEIEGVSDGGRYAPQIRETRRTVVGRAELPLPRRLTFEQMSTGAADCERAEIEGIVRATTENQLTLAMGAGRVEVDSSAHAPAELAQLIDARVRLRGVVSGRFNQKRQWVGARFTVSTPDGIQVEKAAPADPFAAPIHSIRDLLQWELNQAGAHRVKVRGVVTHFQPGEALFIREGSTGLQIRTHETASLAPGDVVEVLGFPALGTYSAVLEDAVYRRQQSESLPSPVSAQPAALLGGEFDANLVAARGVLLESVRQPGARLLVMQAGNIVFHAQLPEDPGGTLELPAPGSLLELTGICVISETTSVGARLNPRTFSLLLRSPDDIRTLQQPSWWTQRRLWQALALAAVLVLAILSWVWLLRRQVREQTAVLKEQTQREAILEERTRIAQELHDTLDQDLTGISLQLNAATSQVKDDLVGHRLEMVRRLFQRTQAEVRRSVWDLRRPALESGGLAAALESTAAQLRKDSIARFEVTVHGAARTLPVLVEHYLLRIAAEAMTNAFRHARASRVQVDLHYEVGAVRLVVVDDGCGFIADEAPGHAAGHFGLIGMRERSRKIGGQFHLESAPGRGTRIEIRVPESRLNGHAHPAQAQPTMRS